MERGNPEWVARRGQQTTVAVAARVPSKLGTWLKEEAARKNVTVNAVVCEILSQAQPSQAIFTKETALEIKDEGVTLRCLVPVELAEKVRMEAVRRNMDVDSLVVQAVEQLFQDWRWQEGIPEKAVRDLIGYLKAEREHGSVSWEKVTELAVSFFRSEKKRADAELMKSQPTPRPVPET